MDGPHEKGVQKAERELIVLKLDFKFILRPTYIIYVLSFDILMKRFKLSCKVNTFYYQRKRWSLQLVTGAVNSVN